MITALAMLGAVFLLFLALWLAVKILGWPLLLLLVGGCVALCIVTLILRSIEEIWPGHEKRLAAEQQKAEAERQRWREVGGQYLGFPEQALNSQTPLTWENYALGQRKGLTSW